MLARGVSPGHDHDCFHAQHRRTKTVEFNDPDFGATVVFTSTTTYTASLDHERGRGAHAGNTLRGTGWPGDTLKVADVDVLGTLTATTLLRFDDMHHPRHP